MPWAIIIVLGLLVLFWFIRRSYLIGDLQALRNIVQGSKVDYVYISSRFGRLRQISFTNCNRKSEMTVSNKVETKTLVEKIELKSELVGTFHWVRSRKSGRSFGRTGKKIKDQQVVGIIDALALKHDVLSPVDGEIVEVKVHNGEPIEYGQVLAIIEKKNSLI